MIKLSKKGILFLVVFLLVCMDAFAQETSENTMDEESFSLNQDSYKSDEISPQERAEYDEKRFRELDKGQKGVLDPEDLKADSTKIFEKNAKQHGGSVTRGQAQRQFRRYFDDNTNTNSDNSKAQEGSTGQYSPVKPKAY